MLSSSNITATFLNIVYTGSTHFSETVLVNVNLSSSADLFCSFACNFSNVYFYCTNDFLLNLTPCVVNMRNFVISVDFLAFSPPPIAAVRATSVLGEVFLLVHQ